MCSYVPAAVIFSTLRPKLHAWKPMSRLPSGPAHTVWSSAHCSRDGTIDTDTCRRLIASADGRNVTFHRAFDLCRNPEEALETIIGLGCNRLLTSGCAPSAREGIPMLRKLICQAGDRLTILPGGGIAPDNAALIMRETGCSELHASARSSVTSDMLYRNPDVAMGAPGSDEYSRKVTDPAIVRLIIKQMALQSNN